MSHQVDLQYQDRRNNIKVKGAYANMTKRHPFHKPITYQKFTSPTAGLDHEVFNVVTTKNADKLLEFRYNTANHVALDFKFRGP